MIDVSLAGRELITATGTRVTQTNKTRWSISELLQTEFPELNWIIRDIVPEGLCILGGRPKVGKSWLALQMAVAVATGGRFFGKELEKGEVLYVALEDNPRRLQRRLIDMMCPSDALITLEHKWSPLNRGGMEDLYAEVLQDKYRLIVFDTLSRAMAGQDQGDQAAMSQLLGEIQSLSLDHNMTHFFNDHTRKPNGMSADPIDDIQQSTAKSAVSDVVMALYKEQGKAGATLKGRGRDIEEIDLFLQWDPVSFSWQCEGNTWDIKISESKKDCIDVLQSLSKARLKTIAETIGKNKGNVYRTLNDLINDGLVKKFQLDGEQYYEVTQPTQL
jgi:RecA-family ATPase